jgi:hypothetical protein
MGKHRAQTRRSVGGGCASYVVVIGMALVGAIGVLRGWA